MQTAVILYGLPPTFTAKELEDLLRPFGAVRSLRVSSWDGASFVIGYGDMQSRDSARQAVKTLHGTVVGGHTVIAHRSMPLKMSM